MSAKYIDHCIAESLPLSDDDKQQE